MNRSLSEWKDSKQWLLADADRNAPVGFRGSEGWKNLARSVFSKPQILPRPAPEWKIPFSVSTADLIEFRAADVRVAGWGPLFGETLALVLVLVIVLWFTRRWHARMSAVIAVWCALLLVSALVNPYAWWARFTPQLWIVPVLLTFWMIYITRRTWLRRVAYSLAFLLGVNASLILGVTLAGVLIGNALLESEMRSLRMQARDGPIPVALNGWVAVRMRLSERGVRYFELPSSADLPCGKERQGRMFAWAGADYCRKEEPGLRERVKPHRSISLLSLIDLIRGR